MPPKEDIMNCRGLKYLALLTLLWLMLAACSRPAKVLQPQARINADATLELAQNLEQKGHFRDSRQAYLSARSQYRSFGEIKGQCYALSGLARISQMQEAPEEYNSWREELVYLVQNAAPELVYLQKLLDIYSAERERDYRAVMLLAKDEYDYPLEIRIQMLSHHLQAESYLQPGYESPNYAHLKRLAERYRGVLKRRHHAHASVLGTAEYALAYHSYLLSNYKMANKHIDRAIDLDYRYEIFDGLASAYWLKGSILEKLEEPRAALGYYFKARDIFAGTADSAMQAELDASVKRLQGDGK